MLNSILLRRFITSLSYAWAISFLYPYLRIEHSYNVSEISFLFGLIYLINQLFSPVFAKVGIWIGSNRALLIGCCLDIIAYIFLYNNHGFIMVIGFAVLISIGGGIFSINAKGVIIELTECMSITKKNKSQGDFLFFTNLGIFFAPLLAYLTIQFECYFFSLILIIFLEIIGAIKIFKNVILIDRNGSEKLELNNHALANKTFLNSTFKVLFSTIIRGSSTVIISYYCIKINKPEYIPIYIMIGTSILVMFQSYMSEHIVHVNNTIVYFIPGIASILSIVYLIFIPNQISLLTFTISTSIHYLVRTTLFTSEIIELSNNKEYAASLFSWAKSLQSIPVFIVVTFCLPMLKGIKISNMLNNINHYGNYSIVILVLSIGSLYSIRLLGQSE